jgi:hypothetical protein
MKELGIEDLRALFENHYRKDHPGRTGMDHSQPKLPFGKGYRYNDNNVPVAIEYGEFQPCYGTIRYPRDEKGRKIRG